MTNNFPTRTEKILVELNSLAPDVVLPIQQATQHIEIGNTVTPLASNGSVHVPENLVDISLISRLVGTCFADKPGTFRIQFSSDGEHIDGESDPYDYSANEKLSFFIPVAAKYAFALFENGPDAQSIFRLFLGGK